MVALLVTMFIFKQTESILQHFTWNIKTLQQHIPRPFLSLYYYCYTFYFYIYYKHMMHCTYYCTRQLLFREIKIKKNEFYILFIIYLLVIFMYFCKCKFLVISSTFCLKKWGKSAGREFSLSVSEESFISLLLWQKSHWV